MCAQADSRASSVDRQVLVVGDDVGGLATAAFLAEAGLSPVVVTARVDDGASDRPLTLWSSALAFLSRLDVTDDLLASATPVRRWELRRSDGDRVERLASAHDDGWPFVVAERARLRGLLRERLPVGRFRLSKTPHRLEPTDGGVHVEFIDGVRERFDVVVGADGPRSWVRRGQFDATPPARWGTTSWTVQTDVPLGTANAVTEWWWGEGVAVCGPATSRDRFRFVTDTAEDVGPTEAMRRLSDSFDVGRLARGRRSVGDLRVVEERVDYGVRTDRWASDRTALVGAAARSLPPVLSVEPSLTVGDAYVLAAELGSTTPLATALQRYARRRRERHALFARHVPFDGRFPETHGTGRVHRWCPLEAALLRSFFARRVPAVSAAATDHV